MPAGRDEAVLDEPPIGSQVYEYGITPPVDITVADPVLLPLQSTLLCVDEEKIPHTFNVRVPDPLPFALVAFNVMIEMPVVVGIPLITPVKVFRLNPLGKPLTE